MQLHPWKWMPRDGGMSSGISPLWWTTPISITEQAVWEPWQGDVTWNKVTFFPVFYFRSDMTLLLSKTGLLISLIYLYYSVSRPCLWFLMQNSTLLLNLWPLCLHFIFDQIVFLHQSYIIFSKARINISLVCSTTTNVTDQERIFLMGTV